MDVVYKEQLKLTLSLRYSFSEPSSRDWAPRSIWWEGVGLMGPVSRAPRLPGRLFDSLPESSPFTPTQGFSIVLFPLMGCAKGSYCPGHSQTRGCLSLYTCYRATAMLGAGNAEFHSILTGVSPRPVSLVSPNLR